MLRADKIYTLHYVSKWLQAHDMVIVGLQGGTGTRVAEFAADMSRRAPAQEPSQ